MSVCVSVSVQRFESERACVISVQSKINKMSRKKKSLENKVLIVTFPLIGRIFSTFSFQLKQFAVTSQNASECFATLK